IRSRIVGEADGVGRVHVREALAQYLGGGRRAGPGGRVLDGGRGGGAVHGGEGRIGSVADPGALDVDQAGAELGVADADVPGEPRVGADGRLLLPAVGVAVGDRTVVGELPGGVGVAAQGLGVGAGAVDDDAAGDEPEPFGGAGHGERGDRV